MFSISKIFKKIKIRRIEKININWSYLCHFLDYLNKKTLFYRFCYG
jgi:hypothetical protein